METKQDLEDVKRTTQEMYKKTIERSKHRADLQNPTSLYKKKILHTYKDFKLKIAKRSRHELGQMKDHVIITGSLEGYIYSFKLNLQVGISSGSLWG